MVGGGGGGNQIKGHCCSVLAGLRFREEIRSVLARPRGSSPCVCASGASCVQTALGGRVGVNGDRQAGLHPVHPNVRVIVFYFFYFIIIVVIFPVCFLTECLFCAASFKFILLLLFICFFDIPDCQCFL